MYPVGSQLPTEHELCERFAVSRYTIREALRRLREDNLVASRPAHGHPRGAAADDEFLAQDVMSINDLLAFATGRTVRDRVQRDGDSRRRPRRADRPATSATEWLAVRGFRQAEGAGPAVPDGVLHQPRLRRGGQAAATPHRPDLPADRGPVRA